MSEVNVATTPVMQEPVVETPAQPDVNAQIAQNLWNETPAQPPVATTPAPETTPEPEAQPVVEAPKPAETIVDANEWLKQTYGWDNADAGKQELERLRKLQETAQTPAEHKFANDESKKYYDAITNGKADDLYNILHQQKQIERLEKLELTSAKEAADIIKTNLQFKHKDLQPHEVERIFNRQYALPPQPKQGIDQTDEEYQLVVADWKAQVAEKEQDMIIDAKLAKPELSKFKSELILPDIPKVDNGAPQHDQKVLEAQQAFQENFKQKLESDYKTFNGFSVTAKDGGVDLPISYAITPEELAASKQQLADFNVNQFLDSRWFDQQGNPNIKQMQEDLYLLQNKDKVFQKIANEASAQRMAHHLKTKSNINVNGVTNAAPVTNGKTAEQEFAEKIWNM